MLRLSSKQLADCMMHSKLTKASPPLHPRFVLKFSKTQSCDIVRDFKSPWTECVGNDLECFSLRLWRLSHNYCTCTVTGIDYLVRGNPVDMPDPIHIPVQIGSEKLARTGPHDSCTPACFGTGPSWSKPRQSARTKSDPG